MCLCFICIIKYIEENKKMWNWERHLYFVLNLHLLTEKQLFILICFIGFIEATIMFALMHRSRYFIEIYDIIYMFSAIVIIEYFLFYVEHVTFFTCIFYENIYLLMIYLIFRKYKGQKWW